MSNLDSWSANQIKQLDVPEQRKHQYRIILDAFSRQGHSGFTAGYALGYINLYLEQGYEAVKKRLDAMLYKDQDEEENRYQSMITADIMEIIDLFMHFNLGKEEAHNITRLLDWKPIVPLTGAEDEWGVMETWGDDRHTQQNKVCSAVFRNNYDNRTAYYLYGRIYSDNGGHTWFTGNHQNGVVQSSIPIEFPFWVPDKPEYVYLNGEDSEEIITDKDRIKELYDEWERSHKDE
jgi:hypothetical protein